MSNSVTNISHLVCVTECVALRAEVALVARRRRGESMEGKREETLPTDRLRLPLNVGGVGVWAERVDV